MHRPAVWLLVARILIQPAFAGAEEAGKDSRAWVNQGIELRRAGKLPEAEAAFRKAAALDPRSGVPLTNLGHVLGARGHAEEALQAMKRAYQLEPKNPEILYNLGTTLLKLGRTKEALPYLEQSARLDPKDAEKWYNLGQVQGGLQLWASSHQSMSRTLELSPRFFMARFQRAQVSFNLNDFKGALADYDVLLEKDSSGLKPQPLSALWSGRGNVLAKSGRQAEAKESYRKALSIDPTNSVAQDGLKAG